MSEREKTYVEDVNRSIYDIRNEEKDVYRIKKGLTPDIVAEISEKKKDPAWMANFRLQSLQIYNEMEVPDWGPSIEGLNMEDIVTYVKPNTHMSAKWSEVPEDIKDTFEKLGIPQAERKSLAGVGAQYDSELVYHNVREEVAAQGVVYTDMESALNGEYADMVRKHFMKLVTPRDHKFAALHGAVWSGGSFVYVPPGVSVTIPLQSYFRLNAPGAGQFEHTLIIVDEGASLHFIEGCSAPKYNVANLHAGCVELFVKKNAKLRYSTIENWSKNMYNLNTKRALKKSEETGEEVAPAYGMAYLCLPAGPGHPGSRLAIGSKYLAPGTRWKISDPMLTRFVGSLAGVHKILAELQAAGISVNNIDELNKYARSVRKVVPKTDDILSFGRDNDEDEEVVEKPKRKAAEAPKRKVVDEPRRKVKVRQAR
jgi:Fe-S cluster assembly protein SufB